VEENMPEIDPDTLPITVLYRQVARDRERRSEEHKREVKERGLDQKTLEERAGVGPLNLYADGDSWFDYPLSKDVIGWLQLDGNPPPTINRQAHWGDSAVERLGLAKRQRLIKNLNANEHGAYEALLFSAGGNDIAGDPFVLWILKYKQGMDAAHGIDRQTLGGELTVIKGAYQALIDIRNGYNPNCTVFLHGYDFAHPTGKPACPFVGPWLQPSLHFQGWTDPKLAFGIVKEVLMALDKMLAQIEHDNANVVYVRTQGILRARDWANELHPTEKGFERIAGKFLDAMRIKFPGRI
jgi:hypothetical protein